MRRNIDQLTTWKIAQRARWIPTAVLVCLFLVPRLARADNAWGSISLPGGAAAARRIGELGAGPRQKTSVLVDLARSYFATSINGSPEARDRFVKYLDYLLGIQRALANWPDGLSLTFASASDHVRQDAFRDVIQQLGLRLKVDRGQASIEISRDADDLQHETWLAAAQVDVRLVAERLNAGEAVLVEIPTDELPLPVPALWADEVFKDGRAPLVQLIDNPKNVFTYLGLMGLDRGTLEWIAARPDIFRRVLDDRAIVFGAFGRTVRVRDGMVLTPGDGSAVPIWENLVGARVGDPAKFLSNLLERNGGRLAYFYATVAEADAPRQAFLLGAHMVNGRKGDERLRYVQTIRDSFIAANPSWDVNLQPLFRPPIDPALAISVADVTASGVVGPDWWPSVFERIAATDEWPARPSDTLRRLRSQPANANWFLSFLFDKPDQTAERWTWFRFAQRRFSSATNGSAPDVEVALRGLKDMPSLLLALERMGLEDPAVFAQVSRAALRLTQAGGPEETDAALRSWQGGIAVMEQISRHRSIPPQLLAKLLTALAGTVTNQPLNASGAVANWLLHELLPALGAAVAESDEMEADVFSRALVEGTQSGVVFDWEGVRYRLDEHGAAAASAAGLRAVMAGPRLQDLAALDGAGHRLAGPFKTLEELAGVISRLQSVSASWPSEPLADAISALQKIRKVKDLPKAVRQRERILAAIDAATSAIVPGFVYALAMSPTSQPARMFADGPATHELAARGDSGRWESFAWRLGKTTRRGTGGTAIRGSLLGLDVARATEQLWRVKGGAGSLGTAGSAIRDITQDLLSDRAVLRARGDWISQGHEVAAAIGRGRALVAAWRARPPDAAPAADELARAGISQARQNQLLWLIAKDAGKAADEFLSVTDLYHLGASSDLPAGWGQSGRALEGCWCVRAVGREPIERFMGYRAGYVASVGADLPLRLAEILADMRLPVSLLEPMLPFAIQDVLDQAAQFLPDDWEPLSWAGHLTSARVDQYLQALVARHVLVLSDAPRAQEGRPR